MQQIYIIFVAFLLAYAIIYLIINSVYISSVANLKPPTYTESQVLFWFGIILLILILILFIYTIMKLYTPEISDPKIDNLKRLEEELKQ